MKKTKISKRNDLSKRKQRRLTSNPRFRRRLWAVFSEFIKEKAADHAEYVMQFLAGWYHSSNAVDAAAESLITTGQPGEFDPETLWYPYEVFAIIFYSRLMDHLSMEEENYFRFEMLHAEQAWQKFFAAMKLRRPDLCELADEGLRGIADVISEEYDLMLGEIAPAITPKWVRGVDALKKSFAGITGRAAR